MSPEPKINIKTEGPANKTGKYNPSRHHGHLGKFFGGSENAPTNISGLIVTLFILVGMFHSFFRPDSAMEFWKSIVLPLTTALLGYLFGRSR